jgi:hypothetical protein
MAALVSAEDFSTFLGIELPAVDSLKRKQMDFFLENVSDWAREISGKPWLLPADAPSTARGIVLAACRREWNNPKRVAYLVKGPQSASFIQSAYPAEFFTEAEERRLRKYGGQSTGDLWTLETYRESDEFMNGYLEVYPHGGLMPVYHPIDQVGYPGSIHP